MIDAMTYDEDILDTANRTPPWTGQGPGVEQTAEQLIQARMRQRQLAGESQSHSQSPMQVDKDV
jgi:hypothetical protein